MAGLPPLFGFIAKEKALDGYLEHGDFVGGTAALVVIVLASILTFAYSARFVLGLFGAFGEPERDVVSVDAHAPSAVFVGPAVVLSIASVLFGLAPVLVDGLIGSATTALYPGSDPKPVQLFAGFNTALLLSSGVTLTIAHHALRENHRGRTLLFMWITVLLGATFVGVQGYEYFHAFSDLNLTLRSGAYGSTFFMLTGFHGFHVIVGMLMLLFITIRLMKGHFTPDRHFGFEGAAWYWHFVDVVWLGLYILVYWL